MKKHVEYLQKYFDKCMKFGISITVAKLMFLVPFERLVGRIVYEQWIASKFDKIAIIVSLPIPTTITKVKRFIWHTWYYKIFILRYMVIAMPLRKLLKKGDETLVWTSAYTLVFNTLKKKWAFAPILIPRDWEKYLYIYVDASNIAIGLVISQKDKKIMIILCTLPIVNYTS